MLRMMFDSPKCPSRFQSHLCMKSASEVGGGGGGAQVKSSRIFFSESILDYAFKPDLWMYIHLQLQSLLHAGVLVATSLGAFGPLFGSDYVYNATALGDALTSLGVTFPNNQLTRGQQSQSSI